MAVKTSKATTQPETVAQSPAPLSVDINLEDAIADELLNDIDWQKVKAALVRKVKAKFLEMLIGNPSDRILPISPFPELAVLPSSDDEGKAA